MPRPAMRLRILPRFPAQVQATAPVVVTKTAGTYCFTADYRPVGENAAPALDTYAVLLQNQTTGAFVRTLLTDLPTGSTDWTHIQNRPTKIDALATLDTSQGAVEQTGANSFAKRTIGGGGPTSLVTYGDANLFYQPMNVRLSAIASTGVATADIVNDAVTFAKMQNIGTARLLGRSAAGSGDVEEIAVGAGLTLSGGMLSTAESAVIGQHVRGSFTALPPLCVWANGQNVSRATYAALMVATVIAGTVVTSNTSTAATYTVANSELGAQIQIGMPIEGAGIQAATTIAAISLASGTTYNITLSLAANATNPGSSGAIFPHGNGNGSTTFTVADARDRSSLGRGNMGGAAAGRVTVGATGLNSSKLGAGGGDQNMPTHFHQISGTTANINNSPGAHFYNTNQANTAGGTANAGTGTANNLPPVLVENVAIYAGV